MARVALPASARIARAPRAGTRRPLPWRRRAAGHRRVRPRPDRRDHPCGQCAKHYPAFDHHLIPDRPPPAQPRAASQTSPPRQARSTTSSTSPVGRSRWTTCACTRWRPSARPISSRGCCTTSTTTRCWSARCCTTSASSSSSSLHPATRAAVRRCRHAGRPRALLEQRALGIDHGARGGLMLRRWAMPRADRRMVEGHHAIDAEGPGGGAAPSPTCSPTTPSPGRWIRRSSPTPRAPPAFLCSNSCAR